MHGLMQDWPLTVDRILDHAAKRHGSREVVTRSVEGRIVRTTYGEMLGRAKRVSHALLGAGDQARRPRRDPRLELGPAHGGLVRCDGHGRRLPHAEPAPAPRSAGLDHQPRGRSGHLRRHHLRTAARPGPSADAVRREGRRADRRQPHAAGPAGRRPLRGADRRAPHRRELGRLRRGDGRGPLLHLGHDRRPQGGALQPPLQLPAYDDDAAGRRHGSGSQRRGAAGGANVPRQRLGPDLLVPGRRREDRDAGREDGRRFDPRTARDREGHLLGGGADGLADAAAASGGDGREDHHGQARGHRRLGLPGKPDPDLPRQVRRRRPPRLGHDRDVAAGHAGRPRRPGRGHELRRAGAVAHEAGARAARRRDDARGR